MFGGRKQSLRSLSFLKWQRAKVLLKLEFDTEDQVLLSFSLVWFSWRMPKQNASSLVFYLVLSFTVLKDPTDNKAWLQSSPMKGWSPPVKACSSIQKILAHPWIIRSPKNRKISLLFACSSLIIVFPTAPTMSALGKEPHLSFSFSFSSGDLYWIGCDKSCFTLIGRHKLGVVQMHVYQPLTKLWCVHLLSPAMQGLTERCRTQIF